MYFSEWTIDFRYRFLAICLATLTFCSPTITLTSALNSSSSLKNDRGNNQNKTKTSYDNIILPRRLIEGAVEEILLNVSDNRWKSDKDLENQLNHFVVEKYVVTSRNPRVARILNSSLVPPSSGAEDVDQSIMPSSSEEIVEENGVSALSVKISGRSVGKTVVDVAVYGFSTDLDLTNENRSDPISLSTTASSSAGRRVRQETRLVTSFDVSVLRRTVYNKLSFAFTIFVAVITVATTFLIGTQLDWKIIIKELKKPASLLVGMGCEFILMPVIAFVLALVVLRGNYGWQLACLAIGACPGGGHSPFWTMMLDGNLDLAVAMSFVASVSALGVLPFWLFTLGRVFYGGRVTIPYLTITGSLFGLVCPIFFGLAFKHFLPIWAERIGKILKPVTVVSFIMVGIFGCAVNSYVFALLDWHHILCGVLLPWSGFLLTYPFARWICRRNYADSLAIAVENGCLNVAVPVVLIQLTLTQPDADLSLVVPVGIVICASWPLWTYFIYLLIRKRFSKSIDKSAELSDVSTQAYVNKEAGRGSQDSQTSAAVLNVDNLEKIVASSNERVDPKVA